MTTGAHSADSPLAPVLSERQRRQLRGLAHALIKVFQGSGFAELLRDARGRFGRVRLLKPEASRARSPEIYLLAMQFRLV